MSEHPGTRNGRANPRGNRLASGGTARTGTMHFRKSSALSSRHQSMKSEIYKIRSSLHSQKNFDFLKATEVPATLFPEPSKADQTTWIVEGAMEFMNDAFSQYSRNSMHKEWTRVCQSSSGGYPEGVRHIWTDVEGESLEELGADDYVEGICGWVEETLDNENLFPTNENPEYPAEVHDVIKKIFLHVFRIHVLIKNEKILQRSLNMERIDRELKYMLYFTWKWGIFQLDKKGEAKAVEAILKPFRDEYKKDVVLKQKGTPGAAAKFQEVDTTVEANKADI